MGEMLVRYSIWVSLAFYFVSLLLMTRLGERDWVAGTGKGKVARGCWAAGAAVYVFHVAAAFHFYHQWSHAIAFAHTRETSGIGEGIFASYLFTALWVADAAWWLIHPEHYAKRPRLVGGLIHAYLFFIAFNGAVVFASGPIRPMFLAACGGLLVAWLLRNK